MDSRNLGHFSPFEDLDSALETQASFSASYSFLMVLLLIPLLLIPQRITAIDHPASLLSPWLISLSSVYSVPV